MSEPIPTVPLPPSPKPDRMGWVRRSMTLRVALIGVIVLLLLIPLEMVEGLINDRAWTKQQVEEEVSSTWGGPQTLTGPIISVPIDEMLRSVNADKQEVWTKTETVWRHYLPEELKAKGDLTDEMRYRGIYKVAGYWADLALDGRFAPIVKDIPTPDRVIRWKDAVISMGITDLRSVAEISTADAGGAHLGLEPGLPSTDFAATGIVSHFPLDGVADSVHIPFTVRMRIKGSRNLSFTPIGRTTNVALHSTWNTPSFSGAFLPTDRRVNPGFDANWTVLHLNRSYPQEFEGGRADLETSAFGVDLLVPVDDYQKSTRAAKYGVMLIVLVFTVFFFVEVLQKARIHPIQYLLVGLALCIFYSLLIALSEHIGFGYAYITAAVAVVVLVALYARSVFRMPRAAALLTLVLILVYGFIFTIIHQEDYALLMGSIGLFLVLATVMWLSRKIDWYDNAGQD